MTPEHWTNIFLAVIAGMSLLVGLAVVYVTLQLIELKAKVDTLFPQLQRITGELEEALRSARTLADSGEKVLKDAGEITAKVRQEFLPLAAQVSDARKTVNRLSALLKGLKAGAEVLSTRQKKRKSPS